MGSGGNHEHVSCCLVESCVSCLETYGDGQHCAWPCDFPVDNSDGFYPPDPSWLKAYAIDVDDGAGTCSYSQEWGAGWGAQSRTWYMSAGCSGHCQSFDTREEILVNNEVESRLAHLLMVSMIMSILSIFPIIGSVANLISDVVLVGIYFSESGFIIVEDDGCQILYNFETGIVWLAILQMILDMAAAASDALASFMIFPEIFG